MFLGRLFLRQLFDKSSSTYTYLIADMDEKIAALIDPVAEQFERDTRLLRELNLKLLYALDTHTHADHITSSGPLRNATGCKLVARRGAQNIEKADILAVDGDELKLGNLNIKVLETPGHTDDSVSYQVDDHVFTGDALFIRGTGRTDFQCGNPGMLYDSIMSKLFVLPEKTTIWPGHDYNGNTCSTIEEEKNFNPRLANKNRDEFIKIMQDLKLPRPKRMDHAIPANMEYGLHSGNEAKGGNGNKSV